MTSDTVASKKYIYNAAENYYYPETKSDFGYKDSADAENRIFNIINSCSDKNVFSVELTRQATDWPSYYHLTPLRANILRPFSAQMAAGKTLELGAGCGAVTRYIGELGGDVVALEGSPDRARVIGTRCADLPNVKVVADLIQNYATEEKFDVVTLIGVLEYSQVYIDSPDPIQTLLKTAQSFLKKDGLLVLAIENQLGLKYLCASPEDHLGRPMFGINDSYTNKSPITFGRKELVQQIKTAGFNSIELYVPLPDYKTPVSIIYPLGFDESSSAAGWDVSPILAGSVVHDRQNPGAPTFSLECAWGVIGRNGLAQDLANSFLFAIRVNHQEETGKILAAHYGGQRPIEFAKETLFTLEEGAVMTQTRSLAKTAEASQWELAPYRAGQLWFDQLLLLINRPDWRLAELSQWAEVWIDALRQVPGQTKETAIPELHHFQQLLPANYIDATPTNFIVNKAGRGNFFDLEWNFATALPLEFIVFRGLFLTLHRVTSCARPDGSVPHKLFDITTTLMNKLSLEISADDLDLFVALFNAFQNQTQGLPQNAMNGLTAQLDTAKLPIRQLFS
jgi:SAM-dependent methyltransferase